MYLDSAFKMYGYEFKFNCIFFRVHAPCNTAAMGSTLVHLIYYFNFFWVSIWVPLYTNQCNYFHSMRFPFIVFGKHVIIKQDLEFE